MITASQTLQRVRKALHCRCGKVHEYAERSGGDFPLWICPQWANPHLQSWRFCHQSCVGGTGELAKRVYYQEAETRTEERGAHRNGPPGVVTLAEA